VAEDEQGLISHVGPVEINWPESIGYFGGIGLAVAFGLIEPPLGLFIAAVPFLKMLDRPKAPRPARLLSQLVDGAAKPVGGDNPGSVRFTTPGLPSPHDIGRDMEGRRRAR